MPRSTHGVRYKTLLKALIQARISAGLTTREAAEKLRTYRTYVAKIEQGERRLDVVELVDLCRAYGVKPAAILRKIGIR